MIDRFRMALVVGAALCASAASATQYDISAYTNANIRNYTGGSGYPVGGSTISINGVDFLLSTNGGAAGTTGAYQTSGGADTIRIDEGGINTAYLLVNSAYGVLGRTVGSITFSYSDGSSTTTNLVEGTNIRDHYQDGYNNSATDIFGTAAYSTGARLDAYRYALALPTGFVLEGITFSGAGGGNPQGDPFLAGITTALENTGTPGAAPEPAAWMTLILGFGLAGTALRSRRRPAFT